MCIQGVLAAFKVHSSETAVIKANGGGDSPEIRKKVLAQGGPWARQKLEQKLDEEWQLLLNDNTELCNVLARSEAQKAEMFRTILVQQAEIRWLKAIQPGILHRIRDGQD
ncbi:hypothetical protein PG987_010771 [Apiospora arundinis]